jgi:hypothetical protein
MRARSPAEARALLSSSIAGGRVTFSGRVLKRAEVDLELVVTVLKKGMVDEPIWRAGSWQYPVRGEGGCAFVAIHLGPKPRRHARDWRPPPEGGLERAPPTAVVTGWTDNVVDCESTIRS